jgi:hypothetical protein
MDHRSGSEVKVQLTIDVEDDEELAYDMGNFLARLYLGWEEFRSVFVEVIRL